MKKAKYPISCDKNFKEKKGGSLSSRPERRLQNHKGHYSDWQEIPGSSQP